MKKKIMEKWVAALESGEYKQTKGQLRKKLEKKSAYGFCCLGVLCNLHAQAHPKIAAKETDPESYLGGDAFPPIEVLEWAGLQTENGQINHKDWQSNSLTVLNDDGKTFKTIAKTIRENYKTL